MKKRTTSQTAIDRIAAEIADQLGEKEAKPLVQIMAIIKHGGEQFARGLLHEAQQIEARGGMMLPNQSRKRTLGGIFFHLARTQLPADLKKVVFEPQMQPRDVPQMRPFQWNDRISIVEALLQEQGVVSTVKVTLIGRPGRVEVRRNLVITTMAHHSRFPNLPKGIPPPPETPTIYTVYIGLKQWRRVEASLTNPDDLLIVEGVCAFDPQIHAIAVYTTSLTTRLIESNRREAQRLSTGKAEGMISLGIVSTLSQSSVHGETPDENSEPDPYTSEISRRLAELYASASVLRQKVSDLQGKPAGQQSGLEMTQKLLASVENQIAALENKGSG